MIASSPLSGADSHLTQRNMLSPDTLLKPSQLDLYHVVSRKAKHLLPCSSAPIYATVTIQHYITKLGSRLDFSLGEVILANLWEDGFFILKIAI